MFYRDIKDLKFTRDIVLKDKTVKIDLGDPDARLIIEIDGDQKTYLNLSDMCEKESLTKNDKSAIYKATRGLFSDIEKKYPDSSIGALSFLQGGNYRIPGLDTKNKFSFSYKKNMENEKIELINDEANFEFHRKEKMLQLWPFLLEVYFRNKDREFTEQYYLDPYQLIDLSFALIIKEEFKVNLTKFWGEEDELIISGSEQYNRVTIIHKGDQTVVSFDAMLNNIIEVMKEMFDDMLTSRHKKEKDPGFGFRREEGPMVGYIMEYFIDKLGESYIIEQLEKYKVKTILSKAKTELKNSLI